MKVLFLFPSRFDKKIQVFQVQWTFYLTIFFQKRDKNFKVLFFSSIILLHHVRKHCSLKNCCWKYCINRKIHEIKMYRKNINVCFCFSLLSFLHFNEIYDLLHVTVLLRSSLSFCQDFLFNLSTREYLKWQVCS